MDDTIRVEKLTSRGGPMLVGFVGDDMLITASRDGLTDRWVVFDVRNHATSTYGEDRCRELIRQLLGEARAARRSATGRKVFHG